MTVVERSIVLLGLSLGLGLLSGCQTWPMDAGVTLPSADYLNHPPQYFPPSPDYPLRKELKAIEDANGEATPGVPFR